MSNNSTSTAQSTGGMDIIGMDPTMLAKYASSLSESVMMQAAQAGQALLNELNKKYIGQAEEMLTYALLGGLSGVMAEGLQAFGQLADAGSQVYKAYNSNQGQREKNALEAQNSPRKQALSAQLENVGESMNTTVNGGLQAGSNGGKADELMKDAQKAPQDMKALSSEHESTLYKLNDLESTQKREEAKIDTKTNTKGAEIQAWGTIFQVTGMLGKAVGQMNQNIFNSLQQMLGTTSQMTQSTYKDIMNFVKGIAQLNFYTPVSMAFRA